MMRPDSLVHPPVGGTPASTRRLRALQGHPGDRGSDLRGWAVHNGVDHLQVTN